MKKSPPAKSIAVVIYEDATLDQVAQTVTVGLLLRAIINLQSAVNNITISLPAPNQETPHAR